MKVKKELIKKGNYVNTEITRIIEDDGFKVNEEPTYIMECRYLDTVTNSVYVFQSENIVKNPENLINSRTIKVFVDPNGDFNTYYVDVIPLLLRRRGRKR